MTAKKKKAPARSNSTRHKKLIISGAILGTLALCAALVYLVVARADLVVGYTDLPLSVEASFRDEITQYARNNTMNIRFAPGEKGDLVLFTVTAKSVSRYGNFMNLDGDILASVAPTVVAAANLATAHNTRILPLLADHLEFFSADRSLPTDRKNPSSSDQLALFLSLSSGGQSTGTVGSPYALAFDAESETLLVDIIGHLVASRSGDEAYRTLAQALAAGSRFEDLYPANPALTDAIGWLVAIRNAGALHPNWYDLTVKDVAALLSQQQFAHAIQYLSTHRSLSRTVLDAGSDGRFIPVAPDGVPIATASLVSAAITTRSNKTEKAEALIRYLASPAVQERLCLASGLAPTGLQTRAPDLQARNVRNWISASRVYTGLSGEGFMGSQALSNFAKTAKETIRFSR